MRGRSCILFLGAVFWFGCFGFDLRAETNFPATPATSGATAPWTTYEAEDMTNTGTILGPQYIPNVVASESSGRRCAQLNATGQYVQFTAQSVANTMVVRYSVPDSAGGTGTDSTISLYKNGAFIGKLPVTSKYSWLYGAYPFNNTPSSGSPRNFYDEVRTNGLSISAGDTVRLQKDSDDAASYYNIDLVDLENIAAPLTAPTNSLSIMSYGADGTGAADDTAALTNCIAAASSQGKSVWLPAGTYKITSSVNVSSNVTIQGAGMWHTTLVGDPTLYATASRRVTLNGNGSNIHLSDFAIVGKLNYRNDSEPNDGLGGSYGTGSTISRIWVEHTKTGAWLVNSQGLVVDSCRFRDTLADGINICVGMRSTTVTNCTARSTGDDCFAIWPATYTAQTYAPGLNVITHCTGQLPFLANGGAIYGGESNRIEDCLFQDLPYGCGILISTTFPVGINAFSGTTVAQRCDLNRCGGYDAGWTWRAALQLCLENKNLSGINLNNLNITNSISDGLSIVAPGSSVSTGLGTLSNATMASVSIPNYGIGVSGRHGLWARSDAIGSMTVSGSTVVEYQNDSANFTFVIVTNVTAAASFTTAPTNGGAPLTVTFTDTSTGTITNRFWSFGDGATTNTTVTSLLHTYQFPGTNTVRLIVTDAGGSSTNTQANLILATSVDTVGDGIPDWWRAQYFGGSGSNTNASSCAACDLTGTGVNNLFKYVADLNPTNPASRLAIISIATITNDVNLIWIGGSNAWQSVEGSSNLTDSNGWSGIFTNPPLTLVTNNLLHTGAGNATNLFYRIKAWR